MTRRKDGDNGAVAHVVARASRLHREGSRFDADQLHQKKGKKMTAKHLGTAAQSLNRHNRGEWTLEVVKCPCGMTLAGCSHALAQLEKNYWIKCPLCGYNIEFKVEWTDGIYDECFEV